MRMIVMKLRVLLVLLPLLLTAACSGAPAATTQAAALRVVASFYPFQFVAERIGGELVSVTNLTAPGSEPHDVELTPKQVASIGEADLFIYQHGFQPAVDSARGIVKPASVIDTATFLTLESAEEEDHDHHEGDGHDHGALDPHTWLDPANMIRIAEHVRDALITQRPDAADTLRANAARLTEQLTALDGEFRSGLAQCTRTAFITSHEAFGYLAQRYGLEQIGIRGLEPDTEPTGARIAEIQRLARQYGVTTIFFETLVSPDVSRSVADDLGLVTAVLDPLEGITDQSPGQDYLEVMRANLAALRKANGC